MPWLTSLTLVVSGLSATLAVAVILLVPLHAPRRRESLLLVAYVAAVGYGAGTIFLARVLSLVGVDVSPFLYDSYLATSLALVALLGLVTDEAGGWDRRWVPLLLAGLAAFCFVVLVPAMHAGKLLRFGGYGADGRLEMSITALGRMFFLAVLPVGLLVVAVARRCRDAQHLLPAVTAGVAASLLHAAAPGWEFFPVSVVAGGVSVFLLARRALETSLFTPLTRMRLDIEARDAHAAELQAFAGSVVHDLKSPLAPIVGAAQILEEPGDGLSESERFEYARMIDRNASAMARFIDSLGMLAKLYRLDAAPDAVDMQAVVAAARGRLNGEIASSGAMIEEPSEWPRALAHPALVELVWLNYLGSALAHGGRSPKLRLEASRSGDLCEFAVRSDGAGSAEVGDLGLRIARRIVDKLGGKAGVQNLANGGYRLFFTLPGALAEAPAPAAIVSTVDAELEPSAARP